MFVTRQEPRRELFDPNRIVKEVEEFLGMRRLTRGSRSTLALAPDLPRL